MLHVKNEKKLKTLNSNGVQSRLFGGLIVHCILAKQTLCYISQEAHEIALFRTQKAEEYRREKLLHQLKEKEARANAIKQGFETLGQMRNSMKDIMTKTNLGMRAELNNLRHKDIFSPDKVVSKALEVSNRVLFPRYG